MEAKEAAEILLQAKEIEKDAKLLKAAKAILLEKAKTIGSIADLKKLSAKGQTLAEAEAEAEEDEEEDSDD